MNSVFLLIHIHEVFEEEDVKFIGVYGSRLDAEAAVRRVSGQSGFRETSDGFAIIEYALGEDDWTEGFVSLAGLVGKERARDVPSWAIGERPTAEESNNEFAKRLLDARYGEGNYNKSLISEFNGIRKWRNRAFK
ncbi:MAG: hypothetical protein ACKV2U_14955 [Bryobacteraceae bacterium]